MTATARDLLPVPSLPIETCEGMRVGEASDRRLVTILGTTQTLGWASSLYLPAILAAPMADSLEVSRPTLYAAFTLALFASAGVVPWACRQVDRRGGRSLLAASSVTFAIGLLLLATCTSPAGLVAGWLVIGLAMGAGLYEVAFSSIVRLRAGQGARAIAGVTLVAGFASTIGWPLSSLLEAQAGWRGACAAWAALHLCVGLPLHLCLPRRVPHVAAANPGSRENAHPGAPDHDPHGRRMLVLLAFVFAVTWFIASAMAAHLPGLLEAAGATPAAAVALAALFGPAQVVARLLEYGLIGRVSPLASARVAALGHPLGGVALLIAGMPVAAMFVLAHGAGNGVLTIAKGTLPLALFGPVGYGHRQGWIAMPARIAQGVAPLLFGLAFDRWGAAALWLTVLLGAAAAVALACVRPLSGAGRVPRD
jgi:MFS family permease